MLILMFGLCLASWSSMFVAIWTAVARVQRKEGVRLRSGSQRDEFAPFLQRPLSGFEQPHDPQTRLTVVRRRAVVADAVDKVLQLDFQRLGLLDLGGPHFALPMP